MPFLTPNQQRQSTEGNSTEIKDACDAVNIEEIKTLKHTRNARTRQKEVS